MTNTTESMIEMYENELEGLALMRDLGEVPAADIDRREAELRGAIEDLNSPAANQGRAQGLGPVTPSESRRLNRLCGAW